MPPQPIVSNAAFMRATPGGFAQGSPESKAFAKGAGILNNNYYGGGQEAPVGAPWDFFAGPALSAINGGNANMGWANQATTANMFADAIYSQPNGIGSQLLRSNADIDIARDNNETRRYLADQQATTVSDLLPGIFGSLSGLAGGGPQRPGAPGSVGPQPTAAAPTLTGGGPWQALLERLMQSQGQ